MLLNKTPARMTDYATPERFALKSMRIVNLHTATRFLNRAFHSVGGQWFGKLPSRQTPTHLQAARTPDHEDGAHGRDARHVLHERIKGKQATVIFSGQIDEFMFDLSVKSDDIQALLQRNDRSFTWFSKSSLMKTVLPSAKRSWTSLR